MQQANFILFDPVQKEVTTQSHHELFSRIKRPKDCSVFNQTVLICTVPEQDPEVIADIEKAGLELRITAYRPSDNKMSKTRYWNHIVLPLLRTQRERLAAFCSATCRTTPTCAAT